MIASGTGYDPERLEMSPQHTEDPRDVRIQPRGKEVMAKYLIFFVVAVYLGSSSGRAASAASHGDGPRTASSNEQDIFRAAVSSLSSTWRQHQRIKDICDGLLKGKKLDPTETRWLKVMLANLDAETGAKNDTPRGHSSEGPTKGVEQEWTKEEQGFGATLFFSNKPQQFLDDWNKPAAVVNVQMSDSASRGKPCAAFIAFTGCGADKQGLADVVADISMLAPDGKVLGEKKAVEICQKRPAPADKQLQLGVGNLGMVIAPNDPAGTYEIRAKVSDRVKGVVLELKTTFSVDK